MVLFYILLSDLSYIKIIGGFLIMNRLGVIIEEYRVVFVIEEVYCCLKFWVY